MKFQQALYAYEILKDPEQRATYDAKGLEGLKEGGHFDPDIEAFFEHLFCGGFQMRSGSGWSSGRRSRDTVKEIETTLEELYKGKQVRLMSKRQVICSACNGYFLLKGAFLVMSRTGGRPNAKPKKCPACSGSGTKVTADIFQHFIRTTCSDCNGTGKSLREKDRCKKCKGKTTIEEKKPLEFWIEKGMEDGDKIVLKGEADQEPGRETGDVIFVIVEKDHEVFSRLGKDLKATLKITLAEALCGFSRVILTTLDGRGLKYTHKVEDGKIIRPKDVFRIVGEGMPVGKKSDGKGDLYLDVEIEYPMDGWLKEPSQLDTLRNLLSDNEQEKKSQANGSHGIVDNVILDKASPEDFESDDAWETEDDGDGESDGIPDRCTTQ